MGRTYPTLAELYAMHEGNECIQAIIANMMLPSGSSGVTGVKHYNLSYLNWSEAAHTFDTDLDVWTYAVKGANLYASSLTTNTIVYAAASGQLKSVTLGSSLTFASPPTLNTIQDIRTTASPTFAGLTIGTLAGVLKAATGVVSGSAKSADLGDSNAVPASDLDVRLSRELMDVANYAPVTYNVDGTVQKIDWYTDSGMGTLLKEKTYSYS